MKDAVTSKMANDMLEPLAQFCQERRGSIAELTLRLNKRTKKKWRRENLERWLYPDRSKRTQPLMGVGLLLVSIGTEYMHEIGKHKNGERR